MFWINFEEYKESRLKLNAVKFRKDKWNSSYCTCCTFQKNYVCHHVIFFAVRYNSCSIPLKYQTIKIKSKKKRGRKKKAKNALERQDTSSEESFESSDECSSDSDSDESLENHHVKRSRKI